jgi:hypothetical protein
MQKSIDDLLDKFISPNYFINTTTDLENGKIKQANLDEIIKNIKTLYLVFHYPQYTTGTTEETKFEGETKPKIEVTDRIFNYVNGSNPEEKALMSSKGITKDNMVNLKMLLSELVKDTTTVDSALTLLNAVKPEYTVTATPTLGGNNMIPKTSGGRNKNKSNKKLKKLRKRNKSSKSLI